MTANEKTIDTTPVLGGPGQSWGDSRRETAPEVVGRDRAPNGRYVTPLARSAWDVARNNRSVADVDRVIAYANQHGIDAAAFAFRRDGVTEADVLRWLADSGQYAPTTGRAGRR